MKKRSIKLYLFFVLLLLVLPALVATQCTSNDKEKEEKEEIDKEKALGYKIAAIVLILSSSTMGVLIPIVGKVWKVFAALSPEKDIFFIIKAFAAGVILSIGFIHMLPDAFLLLTSPCLSGLSWHNFPFTGFVAMCTAMGTLMLEASAIMYFKKSHGNNDHIENGGELLHRRQRVIVQVLQLGITVHCRIIGISLGATQDPKTLRPLVIPLTLLHFFEGIGLGSCITQAKFKNKAIAIMVLLFSLTTPSGIAIGIGITNVYDESNPKAIILDGILNAASAGILIYMALVDLLAADFMNARMQNSVRLQVGANISLILGAGCMSFLAKWI